VSSPAQPSHDIRHRGDIEEIVRAFYRDVATDDLLGPIFAGMGVDWPSHIELLADFWAWQVLGKPGYAGHPLRAHEPVHAAFPFEHRHFERWLELFTATVDGHAAGPKADACLQRAAKMANALERLLGGVHGSAAEPVAPYLVARPSTSWAS
jgi:hemoglobin